MSTAKVGDGYLGWAEHAPFDKIIVTCSPEKVPQPLIDQLKEGGRMIVPVGERYQQMLYLFTKIDGKLEHEVLRPTLFVPMTGEAETARAVKPDPLRPKLFNSSFEELTTGDSREPIAWYYLRQLQVVEDDKAPDGRRFARFVNDTPGAIRGCCKGWGWMAAKFTRLSWAVTCAGKKSKQAPSVISCRFAQSLTSTKSGHKSAQTGSDHSAARLIGRFQSSAFRCRPTPRSNHSHRAARRHRASRFRSARTESGRCGKCETGRGGQVANRFFFVKKTCFL